MISIDKSRGSFSENLDRYYASVFLTWGTAKDQKQISLDYKVGAPGCELVAFHYLQELSTEVCNQSSVKLDL